LAAKTTVLVHDYLDATPLTQAIDLCHVPAAADRLWENGVHNRRPRKRTDYGRSSVIILNPNPLKISNMRAE
jgi:hypothetical protein